MLVDPKDKIDKLNNRMIYEKCTSSKIRNKNKYGDSN